MTIYTVIFNIYTPYNSDARSYCYLIAVTHLSATTYLSIIKTFKAPTTDINSSFSNKKNKLDNSTGEKVIITLTSFIFGCSKRKIGIVLSLSHEKKSVAEVNSIISKICVIS